MTGQVGGECIEGAGGALSLLRNLWMTWWGCLQILQTSPSQQTRPLALTLTLTWQDRISKVCSHGITTAQHACCKPQRPGWPRPAVLSPATAVTSDCFLILFLSSTSIVTLDARASLHRLHRFHRHQCLEPMTLGSGDVDTWASLLRRQNRSRTRLSHDHSGPQKVLSAPLFSAGLYVSGDRL